MLSFRRRLGEYLRLSWRLEKLYYRANPLLFGFNLVAIAYTALVPLVSAWIFKIIIDQIIRDQRVGVLHLGPLLSLLGGFFLLNLTSRLGWRLLDYCERILYLDFGRLVTLAATRSFAYLDFNHWQNAKLHDFFNKVRESYTYRPVNFADRQFFILQNLISLTSNAMAIVILNPIFIILLAIASLPELLISLRFSRSVWSIHGARGPIRRNFWNTSYYLTRERTLAEIHALGLQEFLLQKIDALYRRFFAYQKKEIKKMTGRSAFSAALDVSVRFLVFAVIVFRAALGKMTIGSLSFYSSRLNGFSNDLRSFFRNLARNFEDLLYIRDFFHLLDLPPVIVSGNRRPRPPFRIEFRDLGFHYPESARWIFRHFNLTIQPREKLALVGANGAGKTTLVKLLLHFYDPGRGKILVNGIDLRDIDLSYWRRQIATILQDFNRYAYSFRENVFLGDVSRPFTEADFQTAVSGAEAKSLVGHLPRREKTILAKEFRQGVDLSTGEWQKVALARAFYRRAPILILDEPTAAIDALAEARIFNRLQRLFRQRTVIMVSHRFSTVRHADRIVVLDKGQIIEMGDHQTLLRQNGRYARLFRLQAKGYREE